MKEPLRAERRKSVRYPIRMNLHFTVMRPRFGGPSVSSSGRSIDISRHGILFTSTERLAVGQSMEGSVVLPVPRAGGIPVTLVFKGVVFRNKGERIAVQVARYEFGAVAARSGRSATGSPPSMAAGS